MIKGIFFDFDGVITLEKQGTPPIISYIAKETGLPLQSVEVAYRKYNRALLCGEIIHKDMWQDFCEELQSDIDYDILTGAFLNITPDQTVIAYIKEPQESVFIDNTAPNLEVPARMGFRTIYFDDEKRDLAELKRVLEEKGSEN